MKNTIRANVLVCVCMCVPAVCKEELEVSHVDLPQWNIVALRQRQGDSVHTVIQSSKHRHTSRQEENHQIVSWEPSEDNYSHSYAYVLQNCFKLNGVHHTDYIKSTKHLPLQQ